MSYDSGRQAGTEKIEEIEVTDEMARAGADVLIGKPGALDIIGDLDEIVKEIFVAMIRASR
jgi:hypothetical protein